MRCWSRLRWRRLEFVFGDEVATEQDLADDLVRAGEPVPEEQLAELRRRLGAAWWPGWCTMTDQSTRVDEHNKYCVIVFLSAGPCIRRT